MKFFVDTANLDEIRQAVDFGILDGVTTNPTLVSREGAKSFRDHILKICAIVGDKRVVNAEVIATDFEGMMAQAHSIAQWAPNVVVKIPMTEAGLRATHTLAEEGIATNVTLTFSAAQALLVAKAGATYVSPFIGRLDDIATEGLELIHQIVQIYDTYGFETEVLAASLRGPLHVVQCAEAVAHVGTMPFKVMQQLFKHPLTDKGLETFLNDWKKAGISLE